MRKLIAALAGAAFLTPAASGAQTPPPAPAAPPCSTPEFRQLDFWVGDWELEFSQGAGQPPGRASNRITKDAFGACVITEHFLQPGGGAGGTDYIGSSWSIWDPQIGRWRQTWVDNGGSVFVLTGGPVVGQDHVFELVTTEPRGATNPTVRRMIWEDVTADSLVWRWQSRQADGSWADSWVLRYKRRN